MGGLVPMILGQENVPIRRADVSPSVGSPIICTFSGGFVRESVMKSVIFLLGGEKWLQTVLLWNGFCL